MNKLILLLCFLLPMSAFGQGKKSKRAIYFLELQGGLLFDAHQRADYLGPNQLHIGWSKVKNNRINEIALEFVRYTTDFQPEPGPNTTPPKWRRKRQSIEAKYFLSVWSKGGEKYRFYAGPISSFLIMNNNFDPSSPSRVKSEEKCNCRESGTQGLNSCFSLYPASNNVNRVETFR